ncbi:MAG: phosphoribosylformylglycinamidine cyclo-ligase [Bacteriovoracia bacterium]
MLTAYEKAGVNIKKADLLVGSIGKMVKPTLNAKVKKSIGGFAGLYELSPTQFLAATTDGVGTKLKLAFDLGVHDTVGIDLVAMCVNDLVCVGAKPLFFLDYYATGKLDLSVSKNILKGIVAGCKKAEVALIGGETAEMPGFYSGNEYDLAGFAVGLVSKKNMLPRKTIQSGDILIGLQSSGPHSNGFSLIRKLLKKNPKLVNRCFKPTEIYVKDCLFLQEILGEDLKGIAHITGSGFLNIPRISEQVDYKIEMPKNNLEVFDELKKAGSLNAKECFTTFNMGVGMVVLVSKAKANIVLSSLKQLKRKAFILGEVRKKKNTSSRIEIAYGKEKVSLSY